MGETDDKVGKARDLVDKSELCNMDQKIGKAVGVRDLLEKSELGSQKAKATNNPARELCETANGDW